MSAPPESIAPPAVVIEVRGLINRFGVQTVHDNLDLDVRRGEILGVVGGSGSGKSVLLRSIVGLLRPTAGSVRVFGENLLALPAERRSRIERRFGVLFQSGALFSSLTVAENVALPLIEHGGLDREAAAHMAGVKLALAGLPRDRVGRGNRPGPTRRLLQQRPPVGRPPAPSFAISRRRDHTLYTRYPGHA